jgi:hypothetical protein
MAIDHSSAVGSGQVTPADATSAEILHLPTAASRRRRVPTASSTAEIGPHPGDTTRKPDSDPCELAQRFLGHALAGGEKHCLVVRHGETMPHRWWTAVGDLAQAAVAAAGKGTDCWFAPAQYGAAYERKKENAVAAAALWADVDCGRDKPYPDPDAALAALAQFCAVTGLPHPSVVHSGGGVHLWWFLREPLLKAAWEESAQQLKSLCEIHGFHVDPAPTANIAQLMRLPGTHNFKYNPPRLVRWDENETDFDNEEFLELLKAATKHANPHAHVVQSQSKRGRLSANAAAIYQKQPTSGAQIAAQCAQMGHVRDTRGNVDEPLWYAVICVLGQCDVDGHELAHEWSNGYPGYTYEETEAKLAHARKDSGATTCERFNGLNPGLCERCQHWGKIRSPAQLGHPQPSAAPQKQAPANGADPGADPGANPGADPGTNPGADPGTNPGADPGTNPGPNPGPDPGAAPVRLEDFVAYLPQHKYIFRPTGEIWESAGVNACIPPLISADGKQIPASKRLDRDAPVQQATWAPGEPEIIADKLIIEGGWKERTGITIFNLYRPPTIIRQRGDATPWTNLLSTVFPEEGEHIVLWLAHRAQLPEVKINHGLILGGESGIGKDTILEPVRHAVGPWNFRNINPEQMVGRFNGFLRTVILRITEARDLGDIDRYTFYNHLKAGAAAPPDTLLCDEKNIREHMILNRLGVIITTNYTDGVYLPPNDRRFHVAWSPLPYGHFPPAFFNEFYKWLENGGNAIVADYLATFDIANFDPKAPPPRTAAFQRMVDTNRAPENAQLADAIDALGNEQCSTDKHGNAIPPDALTLNDIKRVVPSALSEWLADKKNARIIPHRLEECGYERVPNPDAEDGYWKIRGQRHAIYARRHLSPRDKIIAAQKLKRSKE